MGTSRVHIYSGGSFDPFSERKGETDIPTPAPPDSIYEPPVHVPWDPLGPQLFGI